MCGFHAESIGILLFLRLVLWQNASTIIAIGIVLQPQQPKTQQSSTSYQNNDHCIMDLLPQHHQEQKQEEEQLAQPDVERHDFPIHCIEFPTPRGARKIRHFSSGSGTGTTSSSTFFLASAEEEDCDSNHPVRSEEEDTCSSLDTNHTDHYSYNHMIQQQQHMRLQPLHHQQQRAAAAAAASTERRRRSLPTKAMNDYLAMGGGANVAAASSSLSVSQPRSPFSSSSSTIAVKDVSRQELDDMKRMVHDMLRNPDLLHTSPLYTRSVARMANYYHPISTAAAASAVRRGEAETTTSSTATAPATRAPFPRRPSTNLNSASDLATATAFLASKALPATASAAATANAPAGENEDAVATTTSSTVAPSTPKDIDLKSSRHFSLDLCHECSNSTSMLFESERRRNSDSGYDANYYLTTSAPQPIDRTRRIGDVGGRRGEEVHPLVLRQQQQQWRERSLQSSQQTQQGRQQQHQQELEPHLQEDLVQEHPQTSLLSVASPTDDVEVMDVEEMGAEETKNENKRNNNNTSAKNQCMAFFPPMPFVPPKE